MPSTSILGNEGAYLGNFTLGHLSEVGPDFDPDVESVLVFAQGATVSKTINVSASNTLTMTQAGNKAVDGNASNTITFDDDTTFEKFRSVSGSSTLVPTHTLTREMSYGRTINQGFAPTQALSKQMYWYRTPNNTLVFSQSATGIAVKKATNTLALSHDATYTYSKGARNTLTLTQTIAREMSYARSLFSNFIPFQTLTREATFRRSLTNTLALSQSVSIQLVKAVNNVLALSQSATCYIARPTFDTLNFLDLATESHTLNVLGEDVLFLGQAIILKKAKAVRGVSILGFNQFARGTKVLHATATNTLALAHALVADYLDESASNTLALSQSATANRLITVSASNSLGLTHALVLSKTINRSLVSTLVFQQSFEKRTGISSFPVVTVPSAQVTVTKRKCMMVLEYGSDAITLPCPEFSDSEGSIIRLNVKRSMNGVRRVYKRDNPTSQLKYDLVMDRLKAIELRAFVLRNNSVPLKLTNFKGEIWYVLLTNSPFTFTEDAYRNSSYGNRSSVSLEFEGIRLN